MTDTDPTYRPSDSSPRITREARQSAAVDDRARRRGLRSRIVESSPPAPVPEPPAVSPEQPPQEDRSSLCVAPTAPDPGKGATSGSNITTKPEAGNGSGDGNQEKGETSDRDVVRSTGSMAIATLLSRITGFIRTVLITAALGAPIASAFNVANTLPNLITEIVLGAVLTSLVVPVLTRAQKEDPDHGAAFVRRLTTLAGTLLVVVTAAATLAAPVLTRLTLDASGEVNVTQSTSFAYWVLPQIFFYGMFSLFMAILNTKSVFRPGAWAPVANNIVSIAVLLLYRYLPGQLDAAAPSGPFDPHVLLLAGGTTLGVVVQMAIMLPSLRREHIDLRPLWGIDARLKQFGGMALAIVVYVAISQAGWIITTRIGSQADAAAPTIYQNAWLLLQVPYGVIGVTLLTAIMPRLSRNAADGDDRAVVRDLTVATKLTLIALLPIIVFMTVFGIDIARALFEYGRFGAENSEILGWTISFSTFTLIPYALVLLHLRVFYAREEAWTPTLIIGGITATKVLLSLAAPLVASATDRVVILLAAANGFGFIAGAVIGVILLRRKLGPLGFRDLMRTSLWAVGAGAVGASVAWFFGRGLDRVAAGFFASLGSPGVLLRVLIIGGIFLIVTGIVLSFSKLEEVATLGTLFQRLPILRRFIHVSETRASVAPPTEADFSALFVGSETFSATPVPPMSAGAVRGPRLVPGAPVSNGRFRLLVDHGAVPGARLWQAREQATGRKVALVFVDTSGSSSTIPASPGVAAGAAAEVTRRTRMLAKLKHPAIAPNIEVSAFRSGCLVVADWVEGSPLREVAGRAEVNPRAAMYAFAPLTDAVGCAREAGIPAGLDNWARIRINTDGIAMLAFPAVLRDSSYAQDLDAVATALDLLIDGDQVPEDVAALKARVETAATVEDPATDTGDAEPIDAAELSDSMRAIGLAGASDEEDASPTLAAQATRVGAAETTDTPRETDRPATDPGEDTADPRAQRGFGAKGISRKGTGLLAAFTVAAVVATATAAGYLLSIVSRDDGHSPLQGTSSSMPPRSTVQPLRGVAVAQPVDGDQDLASDHPDKASAAVDGSLRTTWSTDTYSSGLDKSGVGLVIDLQGPVNVTELIIRSTTPGARFRVFALGPEGSADMAAKDHTMIVDPTTLTEIGVGTIPNPTPQETESWASDADGIVMLTVPLTTAVETQPTAAIVIWFDELSPYSGTANITDLSVLGHDAEPSTSAEEAAENGVEPAAEPIDEAPIGDAGYTSAE